MESAAANTDHVYRYAVKHVHMLHLAKHFSWPTKLLKLILYKSVVV